MNRSSRAEKDFYPEEQPIGKVAVGDLWVGVHPVTNAEFRRPRNGAEQLPDPAEFPDVDPNDLVPGNLMGQWAVPIP